MQQTQKLESLGVLAGGIAHDFNNILTVVSNGAALLKRDRALAAASASHVEGIALAACRGADLCRQMLAYAGKAALSREPVDLSALVSEMSSMLDVSVAKKTKLVSELASGLPMLLGDATQLRQVVMNLVLNASEALADHQGKVVITTGSGTYGAGAFAHSAAGRRRRNGCGDGLADVRPVLHDEVHGPRPRCPRYRARSCRGHRRPQQPREGHADPGLLPRRRCRIRRDGDGDERAASARSGAQGNGGRSPGGRREERAGLDAAAARAVRLRGDRRERRRRSRRSVSCTFQAGRGSPLSAARVPPSARAPRDRGPPSRRAAVAEGAAPAAPAPAPQASRGASGAGR